MFVKTCRRGRRTGDRGIRFGRQQRSRTLAERAWAQDAGESGGNAADKGAQYGFLIKARNCVDCGECVKACRLWSRTPGECRGAPQGGPLRHQKRQGSLSVHVVHALRDAVLRGSMPCRSHHQGRRRRGDREQGALHRVQVLLSSVPLRRTPLHRFRHGQMRLLPGSGRAAGRKAALRERLQAGRAQLRED